MIVTIGTNKIFILKSVLKMSRTLLQLFDYFVTNGKSSQHSKLVFTLIHTIESLVETKT